MSSSAQIAESHKTRVTTNGIDSYAFVRMYHSPPAAHHPAFFETVRAGDERKPHPYVNNDATTSGTGAGTFTSPSSEGTSPNLASSSPSSRRALRREENTKALHRVLLQSWCDNEQVERRIILEREITERHQIVVGGLNSSTNTSYKSLRTGPLSMTVEERAGLRVHRPKTPLAADSKVQGAAAATVVEGKKKSSPSNNNTDGNGSKKAAGEEDEFTDLLHGLGADEKQELKSILDSDTKLAIGLVELYKKMVEERKVLSKPTTPSTTTTTRQHESPFSFSSPKELLPSSSPPPQSTTAHNNKSTEQKRTAGNNKKEGKSKNKNTTTVTTTTGTSQRDVLVQSLITSMSEVLPAELLGLISYDADRESMELKEAEAAVAREQQNENNNNYMFSYSSNTYHHVQKENTLNSHNYSYHLGRPDAEDSITTTTTTYSTTTKSSLNPPCTSAREISDSVYYLYKTLGDFYQRVRSIEARYLTSKWEKMSSHTKRRKRREEDGNMERKEDLATSVIRAQKHFDNFPVTPSSVILVSFFTRLFHLDDPLSHTNFIDLLKTKHYQRGADDNTGGVGSDGGAFHDPTVVKNEFYALPRQERVLDIPESYARTEGGGNGGEIDGTVIPRFSSSASAAQIGALLLDEAAQVVTEFPDAKQLAYDAYGSLGRYYSAVSAESAETTERGLKISASGADRPSDEERYAYPCSLDVVDALPYTAFTSYLRTICGALYPDRSPLVTSQILAAALLRRAHLLLIFW